MLKLAILFTLCFSALATSTLDKVSPSLAETLATKGCASVIVKMSSDTESVLNRVKSLKFQDRAARLNAVTDSLKAHAAESQAEILQVLSTHKSLKFHSFWISNSVFIAHADRLLVEKLAAIDGVAEIRHEEILKLNQPIKLSPVENGEIAPLAERGVELIQAHLVWSQLGNTGEGAVLASIDTGVRGTHETLRNNFLGNYGWFDPPYGTLVPDDRNSHGTFTLGTIVGGLGIGVAPGAKWMACRGCSDNDCTESDLNRCAQFVACPTLADGSASDCTKAPHVVSNSWGGGQGDTFYNSFILAWRTAGIIPVFANGNDGPLCGTANSPADSIIGVIAVGATTFNDQLASYSSVGPAVNGLLKPDISAPGSDIRSASNTADNAYATGSGTSAACPHVSGVVGLLVSENKEIVYSDVEKFLYQNTDRNIVPTGRNCGGLSETIFPNNAFGWGRLNAFKAVQALQSTLKP